MLKSDSLATDTTPAYPTIRVDDGNSSVDDQEEAWQDERLTIEQADERKIGGRGIDNSFGAIISDRARGKYS